MCKYCETKEHVDEDGYLEYWGGDMFGDGDGYIYKNKIIVYYDGGFGSTGVDNIKYCPFCGKKLDTEDKITNLGGYHITERRLDNGWYELSTMAISMGEEYREHMRFDHQPTIEDYGKFLSKVEATK